MGGRSKRRWSVCSKCVENPLRRPLMGKLKEKESQNKNKLKK